MVMEEFVQHLPYTVVGSLIAMAAVWWFAGQHLNHGSADALFRQSRANFHVFHPLHICLSAIATTSLFWRHERHLSRAITVGGLGTVIPCGLSDYVFPYIGGVVLGQPMELHMCVIDHPLSFVPFLALGILGGLWVEERLAGSHLFSHGAHVFVSSAASLLYLVSFGCTAWIADPSLAFPTLLIIVLAVWIPCCISDIVVPAMSARFAPAGVSSRAGHGHQH
jgi:hypothetical protein